MNSWLRAFLIQSALLGGSLLLGWVVCEFLFPTNARPRVVATEPRSQPVETDAVAHVPGR